MSEIIIPVIGIIIGSFTGLFGILISQHLTRKYNLESEYQTTLRASRIPAYQKLTSYMKKFPKNPETQPGKEEMCDLLDNLKNWYYDEGGILMTELTFQLYNDLRHRLKEIINHYDEKSKDNQKNKETINEEIHKMCSHLRSSLIWEVGTRGRPAVGDKVYDKIFGSGYKEINKNILNKIQDKTSKEYELIKKISSIIKK